MFDICLLLFTGVLVQLIGNYRDAVKFNNRITFDEETFIESRPASMRPFLRNMLQLQIFQQFIEDRLNMLNTGQGFSDEFEKETFRLTDKSGKKVKYKDFLRNVKDKVKGYLFYYVNFLYVFVELYFPACFDFALNTITIEFG